MGRNFWETAHKMNQKITSRNKTSYHVYIQKNWALPFRGKIRNGKTVLTDSLTRFTLLDMFAHVLTKVSDNFGVDGDGDDGHTWSP